MIGLDAICTLFDDKTAQDQCKIFINTEYDKIVGWLENKYPAETLCTLMGACEYPIDPINGACDGCVLGFTVLTDIWSYGPSVELLESLLDMICNMFPAGQWRDECVKFVDAEFEKLLEWINASFPPEYICTMIGACDFPVDPVDDGLCLFCEGAFTFLYDIFKFDENSMHLVEKALEHICWIFPADSDSRKQCQAFIDQEYEWLVEYLTHEFPPESICILAKACDSPNIPDYSTECEFCTIFYQFALDLLEFDATTEAIEHLLDQVCSIFDKTLTQKACTAFVNKYYEQLITNLIKKYPTDVACNAMGACLE